MGCFGHMFWCWWTAFFLLQQKEGSAQGGSSEGSSRWCRQGSHRQEAARRSRICVAPQETQRSRQTQQSQECVEGTATTLFFYWRLCLLLVSSNRPRLIALRSARPSSSAPRLTSRNTAWRRGKKSVSPDKLATAETITSLERQGLHSSSVSEGENCLHYFGAWFKSQCKLAWVQVKINWFYT